MIGRGGAGDQELGGLESREWLGEREALVEEEADGEEFGAWVACGYFEEVGAGCVENQGGDGVVIGSEVGRECGADTGSIGEDALRGYCAGGGEVLPGGVGVLGHALLVWAGRGTLAVAAIVEGEDVEAKVVEAGEDGDGVDEGAVAVGEEEDGDGGVAAAGRSWNPPAGELRSGGFVWGEANEFVGNAGDRCCARGGAGWVQDELPLALVEEQAEGEVAAEEGRNDGEGDGFDEPNGTDDIRWNGLRRSGLGWLGGGAWHRSFCVDFSTLRLAALNRSRKKEALT